MLERIETTQIDRADLEEYALESIENEVIYAINKFNETAPEEKKGLHAAELEMRNRFQTDPSERTSVKGYLRRYYDDYFTRMQGAADNAMSEVDQSYLYCVASQQLGKCVALVSDKVPVFDLFGEELNETVSPLLERWQAPNQAARRREIVRKSVSDANFMSRVGGMSTYLALDPPKFDHSNFAIAIDAIYEAIGAGQREVLQHHGAYIENQAFYEWIKHISTTNLGETLLVPVLGNPS